MALDPPRRVPVTDPIWQRYFEELATMANTAIDDISHIQNGDTESVWSRSVATPSDRRVARHDAQLRELRFLAGW